MGKFKGRKFDEISSDMKDLNDGREAEKKKKLEEHNRCKKEYWRYYEFLEECYIHGMMDGEQ